MNHEQHLQECLQRCQECHVICTETAQHCLQKGGKHAGADHIRLLLDCADICQTSADFLMRGSPRHVSTCKVCAEICSACADSCERFDSQDAMMKKCVEMCRSCAESCHQMAQMKAAA
jgi:hypothetical protein